MRSAILLVVVFAALALARTARVYPEFDKELTVDAGWVADGSANPHHELVTVHVALTQRNTDKLYQYFQRVSNPQDPIYGQYKTIEEIAELVAPRKHNVAKVVNWLRSAGIRSLRLTKSHDYLVVRATPAQLNKALKCEMKLWNHPKMGSIWRSIKPYSVPRGLAGHIDLVSGIHHFPQNKETIFSPLSPQIGPKELKTRYNVTAVGDGKTTQAVAEFQGQYYSPSDLKDFFRRFVNGDGNDTISKVVGTNQPGYPGVEAELDVQYIMGVNPNTPTWFYSQASFEFWSDLTAWIAVINGESDAPKIHSISYGSQQENQVSGTYKDRFETEMQKFGTRGISIIFASGDSGAGCQGCNQLVPSFPATSPSVTSVGATRFLQNNLPITPGSEEAAVEQFGSGGGFSRYFKMPSYQKSAVEGYLSKEKDLPPHRSFNKDGRCTPDVSALGIGFSVIVEGSVESVGGTSAATPTFSAIMSLLNQKQIAKGKPTLGFLNPWIYQTAEKHGDAFFDVTIGNNNDGCCKGFKCSEGYDPVTGVGTPNYEALERYLP